MSDIEDLVDEWEGLRKLDASPTTRRQDTFPISAELISYIDSELRRLGREVSTLKVSNLDMERWLQDIKRMFRPWWADEHSQWDGSLCGLPTELIGVVGKIRETESERDYLKGLLNHPILLELFGRIEDAGDTQVGQLWPLVKQWVEFRDETIEDE